MVSIAVKGYGATPKTTLVWGVKGEAQPCSFKAHEVTGQSVGFECVNIAE